MDKNLISKETIDEVQLAIACGQREPVERFMRALQKHHAYFREASDGELRPLVPLLVALQENAQSYFRQLLQIVGLRLMILAVESYETVFEKLVSLYEEDYVYYVYSEIQHMEEADARLIGYCRQVFSSPAEQAKECGKERALMAIYEAGFYLDMPFLPNHDQQHPITVAARNNDLTLARAYITAGRRTGLLHYDRPDGDGYSVLIDVLAANNVELMRLCLNNEANADVVLPTTGESLLDAAFTSSEEMQLLILSHGGKPASQTISALHQTVNSMTSHVVNAESLEVLLKDYRRQYCHEYVNGFTLASMQQKADVFCTAVKLQNKAVLGILLSYLKVHATEEQIDRLLVQAAREPEAVASYTPELLASM